MLYDRARLGSDAREIQRKKKLHADRLCKQSQLVAEAGSQSVVSTMEKFVKAVNEMNVNVILPVKLLDPEESPRDSIPVMLRGGNNRFNFYHCLNVIKKDLVLGLPSNEEESDVLHTLFLPQQNVKETSRRHSTAGITNSMVLPSENEPERKISLNLPCTEYSKQKFNNKEKTAVGKLVERTDSWASLTTLQDQQQQNSQKISASSLSSLPEQNHQFRKNDWSSCNSITEPKQHARKSGRASCNAVPEYHTQVYCDSSTECGEDESDMMSPIEIAEQLREHLQGLQIGLSHLTSTAKYISESID
ncbi:unnamed protein product [Meganyctiphanes norvegica]|uniref:Uncharacterized protein n=1 Tax=Meganyctiphanes norvegica TaxID=48144 RepID=A0AAV2RD45_MEGNR